MRNCDLQGMAILFAEKEYFYDVHEIKHQHQETWKQKAKLPPTNQTCTTKHHLCESGSGSAIPYGAVVKGSQVEDTGSGDEEGYGEVDGITPTGMLCEKELREMM